MRHGFRLLGGIARLSYFQVMCSFSVHVLFRGVMKQHYFVVQLKLFLLQVRNVCLNLSQGALKPPRDGRVRVILSPRLQLGVYPSGGPVLLCQYLLNLCKFLFKLCHSFPFSVRPVRALERCPPSQDLIFFLLSILCQGLSSLLQGFVDYFLLSLLCLLLLFQSFLLLLQFNLDSCLALPLVDEDGVRVLVESVILDGLDVEERLVVVLQVGQGEALDNLPGHASADDADAHVVVDGVLDGAVLVHGVEGEVEHALLGLARQHSQGESGKNGDKLHDARKGRVGGFGEEGSDVWCKSVEL